MHAVLLSLTLAAVTQLRAAEEPSPPATRFTPRTSAPASRIDEAPLGGSRPRSLFDDTQPLDDRSAPRGGTATGRDPAPLDAENRILDDRRTTAEDDLAPVNGINPRVSPPAVIADAMSQVPEGAFLPEREGDPLDYRLIRLIDAVQRGRDRAAQIKIAQVYWRLAIAQADYHFARDSVFRLREATRGQLTNPALRAARCAARALQRDAEVLVLRAQNDLMALTGTPANELPPLAIEIPHVGKYNTALQSAFRGQNIPQQAYLLDRLLPSRQSVIDEHCEGIVESADAADATAEQYARGAIDLTTLLASFERLFRERKAFTRAVRDYNQDIAEYASLITPINAPVQDLVNKMITVKTAPRNNSAAVPLFRHPQPNVLLAGFHTVNFQPGLANSPSRVQLADQDAERALWQSLIDIDTALRTQRLVGALNAIEYLPRNAGRAVSLEECLGQAPVESRRNIIAAYWRAREAAAICQVLTNELSELAALAQMATRLRNVEGGAEAVLRLQATRRTGHSDLATAQLDLELAQQDLTLLCGSRVDQELLLPATIPHGGRYYLRLDSQPQDIVSQQRLDRLGLLVTVLHEQMEDHAGTVVYADAARAGALRNPAADARAFDAAIAIIEQQSNHTIFFVRAATKYNIAIADYAMAVMPSNVPADQLVAALVIPRNRNARL
jgi:hypothetical protein